MEANHGDLTSAAILGDMVKGYNRWAAFGDSRLSHETLCRITHLFLNHHLKDQPGESKVDELLRALPPGFITMHKITK